MSCALRFSRVTGLVTSLVLVATPVISDGVHDIEINDDLAQRASEAWFVSRTKEQLTTDYLGAAKALSDENFSLLKRTVMAREVFAAAARIEGLEIPEDRQVDDTFEANAILAALYEQLLHDRFDPTEQQLLELYQREVLSVVEGQDNASVPEFANVKDVLKQSYILKRIDDHYRTLLIGIAAIGAQPQGTDLHAGHEMSGHAGHMSVGETVSERLAYMTAHFIAGVTLYQNGDAQSALGHLSHPFSEMHRAEWEGLDAFGFEQQLFKSIHDMVSQNHTRQMVDPLIATALQKLYRTAHMAETPARDTAKFILSVAESEYEKAVQNGAVVDRKIYQDIAGYLAVAKYWADTSGLNTQDLDHLITMHDLGRIVDVAEFVERVTSITRAQQ